VKATGTLHLNRVLLGLAGAILALVGCSAQLPVSTKPTTTRGTPGVANIPVQPGTPPPVAGVTGFDAAHVAQVLGPAVAMIIVNTRAGTAEGTGFVISSQGGISYLLTNNHVVEGGTKVQVLMPDGRHYVAQVQGTDPLEDVGVVKVTDTLPVAAFADSTKVVVGEPVVAIGSPLGNQGSVTVGVISAVHRTLTGVGSGRGTPGENLPDVLQTDAPINPGNSGGPLADAAGRVVGMNTAASTNANSIGFAIPSLVAKRIAEDLIAGRTPGHPYLGVCYKPIEVALADGDNVSGYGLEVTKALAGTPAEKAGFKGGDVIEKVDGVDLNNGQTLGGLLQLHSPGDQVKFSGLRGTSTMDYTVTLGDRPATTGTTTGC
jgi:S1-C subfamily serine protease